MLPSNYNSKEHISGEGNFNNEGGSVRSETGVRYSQSDSNSLSKKNKTNYYGTVIFSFNIDDCNSWKF